MCIARDNLVNKEREFKLKQQQGQHLQPSQQQRQQLNNWMQSVRKPLKPKHATRKLVSKAKINLNKYWHKFEEILTAAGEDIKSMSSTYTEFIISQKYKYCSVEPMNTSDLLTSTKLTLLSAVRNQTPNNLHEELNTFVSKNSDEDDDIMALKNTNENGPSYKPFSNDDLYYGVNLSTNIEPMGMYKAKRCSCYLDQEYTSPLAAAPLRKRPASTSFIPTPQFLAATSLAHPSTSSSPAPRFNHRNIRLSMEDCENLENEALQVYGKFSIYDTSF
ncbi:uncharacterized protein LOC116345416 [Contarinia nasturtii]|uniref:uncharacterized protein LOC116345416 n=1 Tax=Contarinia nasturtii TaxID=265458 RepID=UPI0012D467B7|nr:uncharacterized protein LOC116345416 [Contarinia nasturtii]